MHAAEVLAHLNAAGIRLDPAPDRHLIYASPKCALTDDHRRLIREHKSELIALLTRRPIPVPALTHADHAAIAEATAERAAIREFDGGEPREVAEREARAAMRVFRYRLTDRPEAWLTLICPGCDIADARHVLALRFGAARVVDVIEYEHRRSAA